MTKSNREKKNWFTLNEIFISTFSLFVKITKNNRGKNWLNLNKRFIPTFFLILKMTRSNTAIKAALISKKYLLSDLLNFENHKEQHREKKLS